MKRAMALLLGFCVLLCSVGALAEPRADLEFSSATISLSSSGTCTFRATTYDEKNRIEITAVYLFKKTNGVWECICSLPRPTYVSSGFIYNAVMNYGDYMGDGMYRVQAMFNADGHEAYRYSNGVDF